MLGVLCDAERESALAYRALLVGEHRSGASLDGEGEVLTLVGEGDRGPDAESFLGVSGVVAKPRFGSSTELSVTASVEPVADRLAGRCGDRCDSGKVRERAPGVTKHISSPRR